MPRLRNTRQYLSIQPFKPINLPSLSVLVGLNGSGKSQLLRGIAAQLIQLDIDQPIGPPGSLIPALPGQMVLMTNTDPISGRFTESVQSRMSWGKNAAIAPGPDNLPHVDWGEHRDYWISEYDEKRREALEAFALQLSIELRFDPASTCENNQDFWRLGPGEFHKRILAKGAKIDLTYIEQIFQRASQSLVAGSIESRVPTNQVRFVANKLGLDPLQVTEVQLQKHAAWGEVEIFSPPISQIIARYRDLEMKNFLSGLRDRRDGTCTFMSDSEFLEKHGPPPWIIMNEILEEFELPYKIEAPSLDPSDPVMPVITSIKSGVSIEIKDLSSGEKTLLLFALSIFDYEKLSARSNFPKVLLLDEMDSSLHPEMVRRWIGGIQRGLIDRLGMTVILATHSPTTVALAPKGSTYKMSIDTSGPIAVQKHEAIASLTVGLPMLSIDYEGRRQVFVESDTDANSLQNLFTSTAAKLALPRTLAFVATSRRKEKIEQNAGSSVVLKVVNGLVEAGSRSIYGLTDWDKKNVSKGNVKVIGEGTHYALDNILIDPLLIGILLLREQHFLKGLSISFGHAGGLNEHGLQQIADHVIQSINFPDAERHDIVLSQYPNNVNIRVPRFFQEMNGHKLEELYGHHHHIINNRFLKKGAGRLGLGVAKLVISDFPHLCPNIIIDTFKDLAGREV